jgi:hypothetical protein
VSYGHEVFSGIVTPNWTGVGDYVRFPVLIERATAAQPLSPFALIALATGSTIKGSHPKACLEFVQSPR